MVLAGVLNWRLPFLNHNNLLCMRLIDKALNRFFQSNKAPPAFTAGKCEIQLKVFQGVMQSCYLESQKAYRACSPFPFAWGKSEWVNHLVSSKLCDSGDLLDVPVSSFIVWFRSVWFQSGW